MAALHDMSRPVCAPLGNDAGSCAGQSTRHRTQSRQTRILSTRNTATAAAVGSVRPAAPPSGIATTKHSVPYRRCGQRASGELCPLRSRTRRNWLRRVVSGLRPGLARVLAAIPWMRIPKKMQAPMIGVARRTSSPNAVATHPRLRRAIPLPRPCRGELKFAPQDGGATKIGQPPTSLVAGRLDDLCCSGLTATTIGLPGRRKPDPRAPTSCSATASKGGPEAANHRHPTMRKCHFDPDSLAAIYPKSVGIH